MSIRSMDILTASDYQFSRVCVYLFACSLSLNIIKTKLGMIGSLVDKMADSAAL